MIGVYIIKNTKSGRFYVGHSANIEKRFNAHKSYLRRNCHHCTFLQRAWNKYGEKSFEFIIVKECSLQESISLEQYYLDNHANIMYNAGRFAHFGGDLISNNPNRDEIIKRQRNKNLKRLSLMTPEERKQKYGLSGDKNGMFGRTHSEETRKKISEMRSGSVPPNKNKKLEWVVGEERAKELKKEISERQKKRTGDKNSFYGKTHTAETKEKIRLSNLGKKPINMKMVLINGIVYESVTEASRVFGVVPATIIHRIKSKNKLYENYSYTD